MDKHLRGRVVAYQSLRASTQPPSKDITAPTSNQAKNGTEKPKTAVTTVPSKSQVLQAIPEDNETATHKGVEQIPLDVGVTESQNLVSFIPSFS